MDEDWMLYSITSFTFAVIFAFCFIRHVFTFFDRHRIQKTSCPSFPFGNIYDVVSQKTPMFMQLWKFHLKLKRKESSLGGFYIFTKPAVVILESSQMETILSGRSREFEDVKKLQHNIDPQLGDKLLQVIYNDVEKTWQKVLPKVEDEEVNLTNVMNKFVEITIQDLFEVKMSQWPDKKFSGLDKETFCSFLKKFLTISYSKCFTTNDRYKQFCIDVFKEILETKNAQSNSFLKVLLESNLPSEESLDFIQTVILDLKTVNNLMLFVFFELSLNEEIQDELRHEITKFKRTTSENYEDLNKLPYLEAVISETLRKYPSEPFVCKICKDDYIDNGAILSKGTPLFVSIFGIHHDRQNYAEPEVFDPDRFFEGNNKYINSKNYIPFGCRDKNEFGCVFIRIMMKMILVGLLSRFKFSLGQQSPKILEFDESNFASLKLKKNIYLNVNKM